MKSIILPNSSTNAQPIQVFIDRLDSIYMAHDGLSVVIGVDGTSSYVTVTTTDSIDAQAMIQQINNAINSSSNNVKITGSPGVGTPPNLTGATADYGQITLAWDADSNLLYNIYRSNTSGVGYTLIGTAPAGSTSYVDSIASGTTWYYVVRGVTNLGNESAISSEVNATLLVPDTPTSLASSNTLPYQASLTWDSVSPAGGSAFTDVAYYIYKDGNLINVVGSNSYNDDGITSIHGYQVSAVINGAEGLKCSSVNCTPSSLSAPVATANQSAYANSITVSWAAVTNATGYNIYRGTSSGAEAYYTSVATNSFVDDALPVNETFYYKVSATANSGESSQSAETHETPAAAVFTAVSTSPSPIFGNVGGSVTFAGTGFDPSQNGYMAAFGSIYYCQYNTPSPGYITINVAPPVTPSTVEFYYQVGGYNQDTGKSVVFH